MLCLKCKNEGKDIRMKVVETRSWDEEYRRIRRYKCPHCGGVEDSREKWPPGKMHEKGMVCLKCRSQGHDSRMKVIDSRPDGENGRTRQYKCNRCGAWVRSKEKRLRDKWLYKGILCPKCFSEKGRYSGTKIIDTRNDGENEQLRLHKCERCGYEDYSREKPVKKGIKCPKCKNRGEDKWLLPLDKRSDRNYGWIESSFCFHCGYVHIEFGKTDGSD